MAGSYLHVVDDDGALRSNADVNDALENGGDVYEAVEEMYGMIWMLANTCAAAYAPDGKLVEVRAAFVEQARQSWKLGLLLAPGAGGERPAAPSATCGHMIGTDNGNERTPCLLPAGHDGAHEADGAVGW